MAINKFIYDGEVKFDLTSDTVTASDLKKGVTAHDKSGASIVGISTLDSDTSDATVSVGEILKGKTAYVRGAKVEGTMTNNGAVSGSIATKAGEYTIPQGYHDGSGKVSISGTEQNKIIPDNIRKGVSILGVVGDMEEGSPEVPQTKDVVPKSTSQTVLPDEGYTCLRQVNVAAIPYVESPNSAGGTTITIG